MEKRIERAFNLIYDLRRVKIIFVKLIVNEIHSNKLQMNNPREFRENSERIPRELRRFKKTPAGK